MRVKKRMEVLDSIPKPPPPLSIFVFPSCFYAFSFRSDLAAAAAEWDRGRESSKKRYDRLFGSLLSSFRGGLENSELSISASQTNPDNRRRGGGESSRKREGRGRGGRKNSFECQVCPHRSILARGRAERQLYAGFA